MDPKALLHPRRDKPELLAAMRVAPPVAFRYTSNGVRYESTVAGDTIEVLGPSTMRGALWYRAVADGSLSCPRSVVNRLTSVPSDRIV